MTLPQIFRGEGQTTGTAVPVGVGLRYAVRVRGELVALRTSRTTIGRQRTCDIVLDGDLVSRTHACIRIEATGALLEDLGSRNGVWVEGVAVDGKARLNPGMRFTIGNFQLELVAERLERDPRPTLTMHHPVAAVSPHRESPLPESGLTRRQQPSVLDSEDSRTRRVDVFTLLASHVERALQANNGEEAERLIGRHLQRLLEGLEPGAAHDIELHGRAALYAIRIGAATRNVSWFNYAVSLYHRLEIPLPVPLIDQLVVHVRRIPGLDQPRLRDYVTLLRRRVTQLSPDDRFALIRLESLERLASI